ncbi:MAG: carboxylesterase family protein [Ignavibacteriae bacterium]|nr:carboxylesterase family protein [Ignavibacteriota bacterium]
MKNNYIKLFLILIMFGNIKVFSQDPNFHIYLCFGQSNMEGNAKIEEQDKIVDDRFQVFQTVDCQDLNRSKGNWYSAVPPLCRCKTGLGPADYFGRTIIENLPSNIRVGIVNVSVAGCKIELFDKDNFQNYASTAPIWMSNIIKEYNGNPYAYLVEMAKLAQKDGVIKGILLHQGESNPNDTTWVIKVKSIYDNLIKDLNLNSNEVPLLAGETVHAEQGGVCSGMNSFIAKLPEEVPNSHVISSKGCSASGDFIHFNSAGYRKLGSRYAKKMLELLGYEIKKPKPIKVEEGLLQGFYEDELTIYKGIPFAAPPIGNLRWKPPQPIEKWEGIRNADKYSPNTMQIMVEEYGPWTAEYQPKGNASEDGLYLNIWTTAKSQEEKRPVVMYIPGGAFLNGSGNVPVYNGANLAKKGLVVVTINYRVGVFGFFAHSELTKESEHNSSGNYGLLDQLAALKWIQRNISVFGGDPNKVTIMGQSAGAASVNYLTASPLAKGLFIRAISQSGSNATMGPREVLSDAEQYGTDFAHAIGATSIKELRAMSAEKLLNAANNKYRFSPIIDGWFLPKSGDEIFAQGQHNDVTTLTGWVADEGSFNENYGKMPAEDFINHLIQQYGEFAEKILKLYPAATDAEASRSQKELASDMRMISTYKWAIKRKRTSKSDMYTYLFTHEQPGETKDKYLAFHSSELPYVFNNLEQSPRPWTAEDKKISETLSNYWVNFISSGDPNGDNLPYWPVFDEAKKEVMELGDDMMPRPIASNEKFEILLKITQKRFF